MSLKLFTITDTAKPGATPDRFFTNKKDAKAERQRLNAENGTELRFIVSPGPDHHNYRK